MVLGGETVGNPVIMSTMFGTEGCEDHDSHKVDLIGDADKVK